MVDDPYEEEPHETYPYPYGDEFEDPTLEKPRSLLPTLVAAGGALALLAGGLYKLLKK